MINKITILAWEFVSKYFLFKLSNLYWNNLLAIVQALRHSNSFYWINHKSYSTLTEFISNKKFHKETDFQKLASYADKCQVKLKLKEFISEEHIIPTLFEVIDPEELRFFLNNKPMVLKLNTGSGKNFILKEGLNNLNIDNIINSFKFSLKLNPAVFSRELHYSRISPKILAEPLIEDNPQDYKIFFYRDDPKFIQVDTNRFINHKRNFYDLNWNKLPITQNYENDNKLIPKPSNLDIMFNLGKNIMLKEKFEFARIDFYQVADVVYFGETTFFPGGGIELFKNKEMDKFMFNLLKN